MTRDLVAEIINRFLAGESEEALADEYVIHRNLEKERE